MFRSFKNSYWLNNPVLVLKFVIFTDKKNHESDFLSLCDHFSVTSENSTKCHNFSPVPPHLLQVVKTNLKRLIAIKSAGPVGVQIFITRCPAARLAYRKRLPLLRDQGGKRKEIDVGLFIIEIG